MLPGLAKCVGAMDGVSDMATCAQFEAFAWSHTRESIGQGQRELYEVSVDLPPKLLVLVRQLAAAEGSSPHSRTLVGKLDAIEGKWLSRFAPPAEPRNVGPDDDWPLCT
jgi:hypothetical protein